MTVPGVGPITALADAAFGTSRTRARPDGRAELSRQAGSSNGVQEPRPGGNQAAQGALLSGTSRPSSSRRWPRFCAFIARSRFGREPPPSRAKPSSEWRSFSTTKSRESGHRNDRTRFTVQARRPWRGISKSHGMLSLLGRIDLLTGKVHALVRDRHRSREFIEFLKCLDAAYPVSTAIKLILDNHSAHISRETTAWLDARPPGRFESTFTPKHGSWLNLIEGFFSKFAVGPAPHPGHLKTRTQRAHYGRHRRRKSLSRQPHLVIQTRRRRLI
jgi:transposase